MAYLRIPKKPPEHIARAADMFAQACVEDGWYGYTNLTVHKGEVTTVFADERYELVEGEWFMLVSKEG